MMRKILVGGLALLVSGAALHVRAWQEEAVGERIPAGMVAAHMVGRMVVGGDGVAELIGYYPFMEGIEGSMFRGTDASEKTAYFTFRSSRFRVSVLRNDPILHLRTASAESTPIRLRVYYQANPNQDFSRAATFSAGELIGEYEARGGMVTVIPFTGSANTGSFTRVGSTEFTFGERSYDLGRLAESITVDLKGAPLDLGLGYVAASIPFGGTAVAAGSRE